MECWGWMCLRENRAGTHRKGGPSQAISEGGFGSVRGGTGEGSAVRVSSVVYSFGAKVSVADV